MRPHLPAAETHMRRIVEAAVLILFVSAGVLLVLGKLPLPRPREDLLDLLPAGAADVRSSPCLTCPADCPFAGEPADAHEVTPQDLAPVDGELHRDDVLVDVYALPRDVPLPGGTVVGIRSAVVDGQARLWVDIATASSVPETAQWYRRQARAAGWEPLQDQPALVLDAVFLSLERADRTMHVMIGSGEAVTRVFVDHPDPR